MPNLSLQDSIIIKIAGYLIGFIGAIIVFCGGLIGYIFQSHRQQNTREHGKLFDKTDENTEDIKYIKGRLKL